MTNDQIDVLELLKAQHQEVDELIEKLETMRGDRADTFATLADKLAAHATVEEQLFYPAVMSKTTEDLLHESVEEHLAIRRVLADMLDMDPAGQKAEFDAKLSVLKEAVSHHAHEEEEKELFPKLAKLLSADQRAALGNEFLAMFEELLEQEPRHYVPAETGEAAPLPTP